MLYKNKFINHTDPTYVCDETTNNVEWYVYGSASDGRVATVYPRYKIRDNDSYNDNFEDDPPSLEVAYNTEMISNTFTTNAVSASITGIETHRHLGEKRYEIKDHLGNVRAVTSDIKNASNYNLVASSWRFLADLKSLNNYHPYGSLIDAGSWSGNDYNFGYNGMLKEGIGKDISHTHFRNLSSEDGRWWSPDPLEYKFPSMSTYATMGNNPIRFTDRRGDSAFVFQEDGKFVKSIDDGKKEWSIQVTNGKNTQYFTINNPEDDVPKFKRLTTSEFYKDKKIIQVNDTKQEDKIIENNTKNIKNYSFFDKYLSILNNSLNERGEDKNKRKFDYGMNLENYGLKQEKTISFYLNPRNKIAYNELEYGNHLWGRTMGRLDVPKNVMKLGADINHLLDWYFQDYDDIHDDINDIKAYINGWEYENSIKIKRVNK